MRYLIYLSFLFLVACGNGTGAPGGSSSGNGQTASTFLNGTWNLTQFACFDSKLTNQTYLSNITNDHSHTIFFSGSIFQQTINSTNCLVNYSGTVSYNTNYMSQSDLTVLSATSNLCAQSYQMPTNITPNSVFVQLAPGNTVSGFTNHPIKYNGSRLWIKNNFSNGSFGDVCFDVYDKQ